MISTPRARERWPSGNTSVSHFVRQSNGDVGYAGCIGAGFPGCTDVRSGGQELGNIRRLALSLDGRSLYAVTSGTMSGSAIAHYRRSTNGALGYSGCIGAGVAGCTSNSRLYVSGYAPLLQREAGAGEGLPDAARHHLPAWVNQHLLRIPDNLVRQ
jgi:hypothetical protein